MSVTFHHQEPIAASPERVFAAIDDLPLTSKWLPPCVSLQKVGSGPNAVGDALRAIQDLFPLHAQMRAQAGAQRH